MFTQKAGLEANFNEIQQHCLENIVITNIFAYAFENGIPYWLSI